MDLIIHWEARFSQNISKVLIEETTCRKPHPISIVQGPIRVEKITIEHSSTLFPGNPKITACQKTCHRMTCQVMYPSLLTKLRHRSIDPGISSSTLCPSLEMCIVVFPRNLSAYRISHHFVVVRCVRGNVVVELSPQKLTVHRDGWSTSLRSSMIYLLKFMPKCSHREASEF